MWLLPDRSRIQPLRRCRPANNGPAPTAAEKAIHDKLRKELDEVQARFRELLRKTQGPKRVTDKQELAKIEKELTQVNSRMSELYRQLPQEYENHGWVWLFRRQPALGRAEQ